MNETQNRYIDPETGKILDSAQSEVIGGIAGGLLGSGAINAVGQYNTYKDGLNAKEQLPGLIDNTRAMLEKDQLDLELVDLAHQYKQNPNALDDFAPESRELIRQDIDLLGRIHDRDKWDRINELPFKERAEMFIKGQKPSYDGYNHAVVEEMKGIYGPRPMHPEVPAFLREEIAAKTKDIDELKGLMDVPVKYDWRAAAPTLDYYKPKNLWGTVTNPYVATGLFMGAMGGKVYDEYNKHKAIIGQREAMNEKTAAFKLPKLNMPKPKTPKNTPLIPKKVKRVGSLALGAGVLGYTGIKGTQNFREGSEFADRLKTQGMNAKTPEELVKERQKQMKVAHDTTTEGMDGHMKTALEKYEELEKIAGVKDAVKKGFADISGSNVKSKQKLLDDAHVMGDDEGVTSLLQKNLDYAKKDRNIARGVAGATAGTGAAGAGVAIHRSGEEKTAFELYEDLEKVALNLGNLGEKAKDAFGRVKDSASNAAQKVKGTASAQKAKESVSNATQKTKETFNQAKGSDLKAARATGEDMYVSEDQLEAARKATNQARKQIGIAAGGVAVGGAGAAMGAKALHNRNQEKTAFEKYEDLEKIAGIGNVFEKVKKTVSNAKGDQVKKWNAAHENAVSKGMGQKGLRATEERLEQAVRDQSKARKQVGIAAGAGVAAVGGAAMGAKALHDRNQEKTALEKYEALAKEAGIGNVVKKGMNHLTGKTVKFHQGLLDDSIKLGDGVGTIQSLQGNLDKAKKSRNIARGVAGGTALAGAAGTAGGMMAAHSGQQKVASEVDAEDSQYALDHPIKKTLKDGAGIGAMIGAPAGAIGGGIAGLAFGGTKYKGIPAGLAGAAAGAIGGGLTGAMSGAGSSVGMLSARDHANNKLAEGGSGASAGALAGGLFSGGMAALSAPSSIAMTGRVAPALAGVGLAAGTGAGIGSLIGQNQEKHYNNVHNGEFATSKQIAHQQGHNQVAGIESDEIEKAASEVMNELFKEAASAIENDAMEKVASIKSPISKITGSMFGYDRLK